MECQEPGVPQEMGVHGISFPLFLVKSIYQSVFSDEPSRSWCTAVGYVWSDCRRKTPKLGPGKFPEWLGEHDSHLNGPPLQTMQSEAVDLTFQASASLSLI